VKRAGPGEKDLADLDLGQRATGPSGTMPWATGPSGTMPWATGPSGTMPWATGPSGTMPTGPMAQLVCPLAHWPDWYAHYWPNYWYALGQLIVRIINIFITLFIILSLSYLLYLLYIAYNVYSAYLLRPPGQVVTLTHAAKCNSKHHDSNDVPGHAGAFSNRGRI
jgi:hypothetical protein